MKNSLVKKNKADNYNGLLNRIGEIINSARNKIVRAIDTTSSGDV